MDNTVGKVSSSSIMYKTIWEKGRAEAGKGKAG